MVIKYIIKLIKITFIIVNISTISLLHAEDFTINPNYPKNYVVTTGDTLGEIAARFINQPWRWTELWKNNPQIINPHLIYPGDLISLNLINGEIVANINRGGATVKLSPKIRPTPLIEAIPTIPLNTIQPFLSQVRVFNPGELEQAPYVIGQINQHLAAATGDYVYARGILSNSVTHYNIYRSGRPYYAKKINDDDKEMLLGIEGIPVGEAELKRCGDVSTLLITKANNEILAGDRLLIDEPNAFNRNFIPHSPDFTVEGHIIDVLGGLSRIGRFQTVVIDKGHLEGLEIGHILAIYQKGAIIKDIITQEYITTPEERAGVLMVFRVFEQLSYALILEATNEMKIFDVVRNPQ